MEKKWKYLLIVSIVLVFMVGGFFVGHGYFFHKSATNKSITSIEKDNIIVGTDILPNNIYPANEADGSLIIYSSYIFEPLATFDKTNRLTPLLASKWDNPDSLTWRFYISPKAHFSDNSPVTAQDAKFSWDYIQNSTLPMKSLMPDVASVTIIDNRTIEFKTKIANPLLVNRLATNFLILSKQDVEQNGLETHIGSGPYRKVTLNDNIFQLTLNENYWTAKPKIKNVTFKLISEEKDRVSALLNNQIDFTSYSEDDSIKQIDQAVQAKKIKKEKMSHNGSIDYLALDTLRAKTPYVNTPTNPLKDIRVRKAIYQAINIDEVVSSTIKTSVPASQIVQRGIFGYNPTITRLPYDPIAARDLMSQSGYQNGFDLTIDCGGKTRNQAIVDAIANQLTQINIRVKNNYISDMDSFYAKQDTLDSSIYKSGYASDSKDAGEVLDVLIHTRTDSQGIYSLGYSNTDVDKLIDQSGIELDPKIRLGYLQQAIKISMDDIAIIPLFEPYDLYAYSDDILWSPRLDGALRVDEMTGKP